MSRQLGQNLTALPKKRRRLEIPSRYIPALELAQRSAVNGRFFRRIEGVLQVAHGFSCRQAALRLGCSARSVHSWVNAFLKHAPFVTSLGEKRHPGRPSRVSDALCQRILASSPQLFGFSSWTGKALRTVLLNASSVRPPSVRQCQRTLVRLGVFV